MSLPGFRRCQWRHAIHRRRRKLGGSRKVATGPQKIPHDETGRGYKSQFCPRRTNRTGFSATFSLPPSEPFPIPHLAPQDIKMMRPTVFSLGLAAMAAAYPLTQSQSAVTCVSGLYMIAARGSTEAPGEGPLVQITNAVKARVPNSASVAVDYPASIYDDGTYPVSVYEGISDTISKVHDYVAACGSSSKIVLLGFSQGGNVMTDALAGGVLKPDPLTSAYTKYSTC